MASQTRSAGFGKNVTRPGGAGNWNYPTYIYTSNDQGAWITLEPEEYSYYLQAESFGFSIPGTATIDGIIVEIERMAYEFDTYDDHVYIVKGGAPYGPNHASGTEYPDPYAYESYGGVADLWGTTWTAAQINASSFGVRLSTVYEGVEADTTADVDHIRITVYYTEVAATNMQIKVGTAWRETTEIKIKIGTEWKTVTQVQIKVGAVWKTVFG